MHETKGENRMISTDIEKGTMVKVRGVGTGKFIGWSNPGLAIIYFDGDRLHGDILVDKKQIDLCNRPIKFVFNMYHGLDVSITVPFEDYPVPEMYGFRLWTTEVYPCYDTNNKYMGYMDNGTFCDMREGYYCSVCRYETLSFWKALYHHIKHLGHIRNRKPFQKHNKYHYLNLEEVNSFYRNMSQDESDFYW